MVEHMNEKNRYIVISPVRDEAKYIEKTIMSMASQTVQPVEWVIVNDGSMDNTAAIIGKYLPIYSWIKIINRENRGYRKAGGGVIDAFNEGYNSLEKISWDFLVKLDGDLSFDNDYFEKCFSHFQEDTTLGVGGGVIANLISGTFVKDEKNPDFHVRGATKIYRRECWEDIGGLLAAPGWDTLDEVKANMLGWKTRTFQELTLCHYRPTGAADGTWANAVKNGKSDYICGYHPLFMMLKCAKRMFEKPYLIGGLGHLYGFFIAYLNKIPQVPDLDLIKYLRREQIKRLFGRKSIWI
jgi:poly-beta-1,6-N-acetyl-D-glucosamine synthase